MAANTREASKVPCIEAFHYLRYYPDKAWEAWGEVSLITWIQTGTIMAPRGDDGKNWDSWGNGRSCPFEYKAKHRSIALPWVSPRKGTQSLGGGVAEVQSSHGRYYHSQGANLSENRFLVRVLNWCSPNVELKATMLKLPAHRTSLYMYGNMFACSWYWISDHFWLSGP